MRGAALTWIHFYLALFGVWGSVSASLGTSRKQICPSRNIAKGKIQGGTDASPGRYPYAVSLQRPTFRRSKNPKDHFCGGVLVAEDLVITAAHCVHPGSPGSEMFPLLNIGGRDLINDPDTERRTVCRTIVHQSFQPDNIARGFDIALLELEHKSTKRPVRMDIDMSGSIAEGSVRALGWGKDETHPYFVQLQQVDFNIVNNIDCRESGFPGVSYSMLCAQGIRSDVCKGDSGGPLIKTGAGCGEKDILVGLTSFGFSCSNPQQGQGMSPGVYTRIFEFCDWITDRGRNESDIWENPDCQRKPPASSPTEIGTRVDDKPHTPVAGRRLMKASLPI